jgi:hypothetical protein
MTTPSTLAEEEDIWLTVAEAAAALNTTPNAIRSRCRRGTLECRKVRSEKPGKGAARLWVVSKTSVHAEAERMAVELRQKAKGLKHCPRCGGWFSPEEMCPSNKGYCDPCGREYFQEYWDKRRRRIAAPATEPEEPKQFTAQRIEEITSEYACLFGCFQHRPIPPGSTRRSTYCSGCKARFCYFHKAEGITPADMHRGRRPRTRYPAMSVTRTGE